MQTKPFMLLVIFISKNITLQFLLLKTVLWSQNLKKGIHPFSTNFSANFVGAYTCSERG